MMRYYLTLAMSDEELAQSLPIDANEIIDDADRNDIIAVIRLFGEVVSLGTS